MSKNQKLYFLFSKAFDYDDISGVYLGPRRAFDDEDLEYLCKELEDQEGLKQGVKQERPQSPPLIVDSVSGSGVMIQNSKQSLYSF